MLLQIAVGGWCPLGRRSEDGRIPAAYPLRETASRTYAVRTEWNVRDSEATLILVLNEISSGTRMTIEAARALGRPLQIVHLLPDPTPGLLTAENTLQEQLESVVEWIHAHRIRILNVAGPRGSSSDEVYSRAFDFMTQLLQSLTTDAEPSSPEPAVSAAAVTPRRRKRRNS